MGVTGLSLRYVEEDGAAAGTTGRTWVGDVQVGWRLRGFDRHDAHREVALTFREDGARARFVTARRATAGQDATPLWMLGPVFVRRGPRTLVVTTRAGTTRRFSRLAEQAVTDVRRVLGAVARPAGGRGARGPARPDPGARLGARGVRRDRGRHHHRGRQPVPTGAGPHLREPAGVRPTGSARLPDRDQPRGHPRGHWGRAVHDADVAARGLRGLRGARPRRPAGDGDRRARSSGRSVARVRPGTCPGRRSSRRRTGSSGRRTSRRGWLPGCSGSGTASAGCSAFYRAADRASSTAGPFRTVLGTDQRAFTRAWRDDLRRLAR